MKTLPLEIRFENGRRKTYQVSGTRHAGNLLRKLGGSWSDAWLTEPLGDTLNKVHVTPGGGYGFFFDRNNTNYEVK